METIHITANTNDTDHIKAIKSLFKALKVEFTIQKEKKSPYNEDFVAKIKESQKQFKEGKYATLSLDDVWKND